MSKSKKDTSTMQLQRYQIKITVIFITIIIAITLFLTTVLLSRTEDVIRDNTSKLIAANSRQLQLNINNYLDNVEKTSALMFADESYYLYDATDESIEEYDQIQYETAIMNRIVDLGLMQNFSDFGMLYANDHTVGWISNTTQNLFPDGGIYGAFTKCINNEKTKDGWVFGIADNYDRLYYVKRLNTNTILLASFHINELNTVFEYPKELEGMTVYLVDDTNQILYSTDDEQAGIHLSTGIASLVGKSGNVSASSDKLIANSNVCKNGWRVVCEVSTGVIMKDIKTLRDFTVIIVAGVVIVSVFVSFALVKRASKPMDTVVSNLEKKATIDELSGVHNKASFEEETSKKLDNISEDEYYTFIMLDMDNFKTINDTLGHNYGDDVIRRMGQLLKSTFSEKSIIGRLGGDEFAIFRVYKGMTEEQLENRLKVRMNFLMDMFAEEFAEEQKSCNVSLSIGIADERENHLSYEQIYKNADTALYKSKNNGKNQFNFYIPGGDADE